MTKTRKNLFLTILVFMLSLSMAIFAGTASASGSTTVTADKFYAAQSAQVRTVPDENGKMGLGFVSYIDYTLYNNLLDSGAKVETGTIIMPEYYVSKQNAKLTLDWVEENGLKNKCIVENTGFINRDQANETTPYFYRGRIDVKEANYTLDFIGCGYITVDGVTYYTYGDDQSKAVVANVKEVALEFAKSDDYFNEIVDDVPAARTQINAYISAWDFNEKLFDPENDFRRISYGGTTYDYKRYNAETETYENNVVDASTLGFGGNAYTGKAIKLEKVGAWQAQLALDGAKYHDIITNSDYYTVTLNIAFAHSNLDAKVAEGKFTGITLLGSSSPFFNSASSFGLKSMGVSNAAYANYNKWLKITIPVASLIENDGFVEDSTTLKLFRIYMGDGIEAKYTTNDDPVTNYSIYVGEITLEKVSSKLMKVVDNQYSASTMGMGVLSTYPLATAEELATITGDYNGGAYKARMETNGGMVGMYVDGNIERLINNEQYTETMGYKYVAFNLAYMPDDPTHTPPTYWRGLIPLLKFWQSSGNVTSAGITASNTWYTVYTTVENIINLGKSSLGYSFRLFDQSNGAASKPGYMLVGDVDLLKEAPTGTNVVNVANTVTQEYFDTSLDTRFNNANTHIYDAANSVYATAATEDELVLMTGYSQSISGVEKVQVPGSKSTNSSNSIKLHFGGQTASTVLSRVGYLADFYPQLLTDYYVTTYIAVTGTAENTLSFGGGVIYNANNKKALTFGADGDYQLNTWYKVVMPISVFLSKTTSGTGETLLTSPTVSAGAVTDYTVWISDFSHVNATPSGYDGTSCIVALPTANA